MARGTRRGNGSVVRAPKAKASTMKHLIGAVVLAVITLGTAPAEAKHAVWDCGWHVGTNGKHKLWSRCAGRHDGDGRRAGTRSGRGPQGADATSDAEISNVDHQDNNGGNGGAHPSFDADTNDEKSDNGNHYGNDKPDNNDNDDKNKHDGEDSKADHHDNNGEKNGKSGGK
jgi:hypothetical protein